MTTYCPHHVTAGFCLECLRAERDAAFAAGLEAAARWVEEASAVMLIDAPDKIRALAPKEGK